MTGAAHASGFLPGQHLIDGYGTGGFKFGGMSHRGSILALPSGLYAWNITAPEEIDVSAFTRILDEAKGSIEHLLLGTGLSMHPIAPAIRQKLRAAGIVMEPMATGAAARTYNILLGERRRVAAALIAV